MANDMLNKLIQSKMNEANDNQAQQLMQGITREESEKVLRKLIGGNLTKQAETNPMSIAKGLVAAGQAEQQSGQNNQSQKQSGNIDLNNRPKIDNQDGSYSTESSFSVNIDGKEVLLPSIIKGKRVSQQEAIQNYKQTGENLGIFNSIDEANAAAKNIHNRFNDQSNAGNKNAAPNNNKDTLRRILMSLGGGLAAAGGNTQLAPALLKMEQSRQKTANKRVYGFDPQTGKVSLQSEIPEGSELRNMQGDSGISTLSLDLQASAYGLAKKIGGQRKMLDVLPSIVRNLKAGKTIDEIDDVMRFMKQSPEFNKKVRNAAQNIFVGKSEGAIQASFNALDDYTEAGDMDGAQDYLKRMAIKSSSADQQKLIMGKERTVDFLDEIQSGLDAMDANGIDTGFFSGNLENLLARAGQVKSPEMREIAIKMATATIMYRRSMTGVQFGEKEAKEYKKIFPDINKVAEFNKASTSALRSTFGGDLDKFYSLSMGEKNYNKLFKSDETADASGDDSAILKRMNLDPNKYEIVR